MPNPTMAERDATAAFMYAGRVPADGNLAHGLLFAGYRLRQAFLAGTKHGRANPLAEGEQYDGTHDCPSEVTPLVYCQCDDCKPESEGCDAAT